MTMNEIEKFIIDKILPRNDLLFTDTFPVDIWEAMGSAGLFKVGIPEEYNGSGGGWKEVVGVARAIVLHGGVPGLSISWLMHALLSKLLLCGFGNNAQRKQFLPELASGRLTTSFAVSEPKVGPHPKFLSTTAVKSGNTYTLDGEKTFLTNSPIAGLFIVIAITDEDEGRKKYTAFLVDRETKGLSITEPLNIGFLKPALHGGIILKKCQVDEKNILGSLNTAYEDMVIPFRTFEDIVMAGAVAGGMERQVRMLAAKIRTGNVQPNENTLKNIGSLFATADAARILGSHAAGLVDDIDVVDDANTIDNTAPHPDLHSIDEELTSQTVFLRTLAFDFQKKFAAVLADYPAEPCDELETLTRDISKLISIASNIVQEKKKKLGTSLLNPQ